MKIELPPIFINNIHATYGETGKRWLTELPQHLACLSDAWNFQIIHPISDLSYGFVALVRLNDSHSTAILKTTPGGGNILTEARWLQSFEGGVPKVYHIDEERHAFLMEHLEPGTTLKSLVQEGRDEEATRIICQTILELHSSHASHATHTTHSTSTLNPTPNSTKTSTSNPNQIPIASTISSSSPSFKHLSELSEALPFLKGHMNETIIFKALSLFHDLSSDRRNDILLHGDLHHENILQSGSSWKVIDPHGYIGDPAAEVGTMIRNPYDCFPKDKPLKKVLERRLNILSEMLPFDPKRIYAWAFCCTILSAAWDVEGFNEVTSNTAEVGFELNNFI